MNSTIFLAWDGDGIGRLIGLATMHDQPEELARLSAAIDRGNRIFEAWCVEGGGRVVQSGGDEGRAMIPASRLDRLEEVRTQYQEATGATVSVGIGARLSESARALYAAKLRGKDRSVVHSPEVDAEVEKDLAKERTESSKLAEEYGSGLDKAEPAPAESTPQASLADELREAAQASTESEGANKVKAGKEGDQARAKLALVLRSLQGKAKELAALKERAPAAVEALAELLDAVRDVARLLPKSEVSDSSPAVTSQPAPEGAPVEKGVGGAEAGREKLTLPVGTEHDGRVKVRHENGRVSWVSVRSGMVLAQDPAGHAASARNPSIT